MRRLKIISFLYRNGRIVNLPLREFGNSYFPKRDPIAAKRFRKLIGRLDLFR
jgi:hypothetical protein